MKIKTRSILQELNDIAENKNKDVLIESRALNVINSAIHIIESFYKNYDAESAADLERRLINSIKGHDGTKFQRGIRKVAESARKQRLLESKSGRTK
jgi:hypothetical protein